MAPEFTLRQLQYFVAVLDAGSVTDAAKNSNISQAAASMAIGQLERALGVELLLRTRSKRVVPTAAGEALGVRARRVLGEAAEIPDAVRSGWEELRGRVTVGCMVAISPRLMPRLLAEVGRRWPDIDLDFSEGAAEELQQAAAGGSLDAAFVYSLQAVSGVDLIPIAESRMHFLLPENHPLANHKALHLADLADEDAVLFNVPPSAERVMAMFQAASVEPRVRWKSVVSETIRGIVASGQAYSVTNIWPGMEHLYPESGVALVPVADEVPGNGIVAAVPPGGRRPRRVEVVIQAAKEIASTTTNPGPPPSRT